MGMFSCHVHAQAHHQCCSHARQFLAFRLLEVKGNVQELTAELDKTKVRYVLRAMPCM